MTSGSPFLSGPLQASPMTSMIAAGAANARVGEAWGAIRIDVDKAIRDMNLLAGRVGVVETQMEGTGAAAGVAANAFSAWAVAGQAALGATVTYGIQSAKTLRDLNLQFSILSRSEEEANTRMADIRAMTDRTKQPFLELAKAGGSLLPMIRNNNAELSTTLDIAQRLLLLDPTARTFDAQMSIREFMSGEYLSMTRRFELPRAKLRVIVDEANGDVQKSLELLSDYLDSMGVTSEALVQMGDAGVYSFRRLGSEIEEALGGAMMPFLQEFLVPGADLLANVTRGVRELGEALGRIETPDWMDGLGQVASSAGSLALGAAGIAGALKAGSGLAGRFGGAGVGAALSGAVPVVVSLIAEAALIQLGTWVLKLFGGPDLTGMDIGEVLTTFLAGSGAMLTQGIGNIKVALGTATQEEVDAFASEVARTTIQMLQGAEAAKRYEAGIAEVNDALQIEPFIENVEDIPADILEAFATFEEDLEKIRESGEKKKQDTIASHVERSAQLEDTYQTKRARTIEDNLRTEQQRLDDHNAKVAEIKADSDQKALEKLEDYQRKRERLLAEHHINMLDAAMNLDAQAVWNEQNRFELKMQDLEYERNKEVESQQAQTAERIQQENDQFALLQARRDEQFQIRMQREADDHRLELERLGAQTNAKLLQIDDQMNRELAEREDKFKQEISRLDAHYGEMLGIQNSGLTDLETRFRAWFQQMSGSILPTQVETNAANNLGMVNWTADDLAYYGRNNAALSQAGVSTGRYETSYSGARSTWPTGPTSQQAPAPTTITPGSRTSLGAYTPAAQAAANSWMVNYTPGQMTKLSVNWQDEIDNWSRLSGYRHSGAAVSEGMYMLRDDEEVLGPSVSRALRSMYGGVIDQNALLNAASGGNRSVGDIQINITEPGASAADIGYRVREELMAVLEAS